MQLKQKFCVNVLAPTAQQAKHCADACKTAALLPLCYWENCDEAANHGPAERGERVTLYKIVGQQAPILNDLWTQLCKFFFLELSVRLIMLQAG